MTDAALTKASTYAQVRVREPIGDRTFGETPTIGGEGADIVVPGVAPGPAVRIERQKGVWIASPVHESKARFDGLPLGGPRDLRHHDVMAVGDAQIIVAGVSRTLLRLEVCHLVGNATISPAATVSQLPPGEGDEELLIRAPSRSSPAEPVAARRATSGRGHTGLRWIALPRTRRFWNVSAAFVAVALLIALLL